MPQLRPARRATRSRGPALALLALAALPALPSAARGAELVLSAVDVVGAQVEVGFHLEGAFDEVFQARLDSGLPTGFVYRFELQGFGNRLLAGLVPGRATIITDSEGQQEVVLHKMLNGHFETGATVNGQEISMLVDTGASSIALSYEDAERIGLDPANLNYIVTVMTANGRAQAAPVMLEEISIGPITRRNIGARMAMPFSPFFTCRPSFRQAEKPATCEARGNCR